MELSIKILKDIKFKLEREKAETILAEKLFRVELRETMSSINKKIEEIDKGIKVLENYQMARKFMEN